MGTALYCFSIIAQHRISCQFLPKKNTASEEWKTHSSLFVQIQSFATPPVCALAFCAKILYNFLWTYEMYRGNYGIGTN